MSSGAGASRLASEGIKQLASERAREKASTPRWDVNVVILAYAILAAVVILSVNGVATEIVAPVAILGLVVVWFMGWRKGKQLYQRFYDEELRQLQEFPRGKEAEVLIPSPLTRRETEILGHIACGYLNKQIADKLGISEQTIKNHMSSILRKLDANDRTQAVVLSLRNGWISSPDRETSEPIARN